MSSVGSWHVLDHQDEEFYVISDEIDLVDYLAEGYFVMKSFYTISGAEAYVNYLYEEEYRC